MFKKISIVFVFCFGIIIGFLICYMHYKDKIMPIPKQSMIDKSITKFYPEYDLLEYISDITDGTETLDTIGKAFDIEYMQETEDKDKCYIVLKSLEGGYFFIFFEKKGDKYFSTTRAYFKDYVPLANEYVNKLTRIDHKYSNNDFSGYEDVVNLYWYIPYDQYGKFMDRMHVITRDFVVVQIFFKFDTMTEKRGVECVQTDCTAVDFVLPEDKEFILNKFSEKKENTPKHEMSYMYERFAVDNNLEFSEEYRTNILGNCP